MTPARPFHALPWREEETLTSGRSILRPTVDVTLFHSNLSITTKALIDTGSPRCVFPRGVGDLIAVEFPRFASDADKKIQLMGRSWPAMTAGVGLEIDGFTAMSWEAEVDFVLDEGLPFALLGFEGFLNRWAVSFNGYLGYFIIEPADKFDARQPPEILDDLRIRHPELFRD